MKDYDESSAFLGQWGCFQQVVFFVLAASTIPNGSGVFSIVFLADIPRHHCLVPDANLTEDWLNAVIPIEVTDGEEERSSCSRYRLDVVKNLSSQGLIPGRDINLTQLEQESCVDGWSYSKDIYQSTIVSEFDLVCSEQWKQPFTSTVIFLGVLIGSFISGQLSDRFGRKTVLFATMAVQTIFTFVQIFSSSWLVLCVLLFIAGMGQISNYVSGFVLGIEILTGSVRVLFSSMGVCLGYAVGYMMLPLFAYYLRNWKSLLLALSLPGLAYIPLWWFIPESPRWLLSQGRVEEAEAIVRKAARWNKVEAPQVIFEKCSSHVDEVKTQQKEHHNVFSLLRTNNIRNTTLILGLVWFTLSIGYFGLSLNTSRLHADPYLSCFISAAVEIPAYIACWLALQYIPRRVSTICVLLLGGVSLFLIQLIPQSLQSLSVALEMLGKFGITCGSSLIYSYTAELYPTGLRNTATGTCTTLARVGSCIAPFLLQLSYLNKYLPYIILGTLYVVSAFAALFLPESFRRPLPETIQQMHKRGSLKWPIISRKQHSKPGLPFETKL
ncbi:organic cation/carnitine transporter 2-like [Labrus mixtus]|uniref:organic cation/carnitine transporter 2-like n=1 Tax=Labrus mixtus TaxID=508554 RepID=UPI0029C09D0F|nr:organic cation/carnitine transporter 2-like [Labrus mixtus]